MVVRLSPQLVGRSQVTGSRRLAGRGSRRKQDPSFAFEKIFKRRISFHHRVTGRRLDDERVNVQVSLITDVFALILITSGTSHVLNGLNHVASGQPAELREGRRAARVTPERVAPRFQERGGSLTASWRTLIPTKCRADAGSDFCDLSCHVIFDKRTESELSVKRGPFREASEGFSNIISDPSSRYRNPPRPALRSECHGNARRGHSDAATDPPSPLF